MGSGSRSVVCCHSCEVLLKIIKSESSSKRSELGVASEKLILHSRLTATMELTSVHAPGPTAALLSRFTAYGRDLQADQAEHWLYNVNW